VLQHLDESLPDYTSRAKNAGEKLFAHRGILGILQQRFLERLDRGCQFAP